MPPTDQLPWEPETVRASSLGTVSVVIMARAAQWAAWVVAASSLAATSVPARSAGMAMGSPMTPVEHTSTSWARHPSRPATFSAVATVSA